MSRSTASGRSSALSKSKWMAVSSWTRHELLLPRPLRRCRGILRLARRLGLRLRHHRNHLRLGLSLFRPSGRDRDGHRRLWRGRGRLGSSLARLLTREHQTDVRPATADKPVHLISVASSLRSAVNRRPHQLGRASVTLPREISANTRLPHSPARLIPSGTDSAAFVPSSTSRPNPMSPRCTTSRVIASSRAGLKNAGTRPVAPPPTLDVLAGGLGDGRRRRRR